MKKMLYLSLFMLIFTIITCSSDSDIETSTIYINFFNDSKNLIDTNKELQGSSFPGNINQIRVAVYDADSKKIYDKIYGRDVNEAAISVTSGPARILIIEGLSILKNPIYRGVSDPTDLAPGETTTIPVTMEAVPVQTASLTINLRNIDDTADFAIASHADLNNNQIRISIFTADSEVFNQENIEDINISCDLNGDYSINNTNDYVDDTNFPLTITVPANSFLVIAARGNSISHNGFLTVLGAAFISNSALIPDSTDNQVSLRMLDCAATGEDNNSNGWNDYCECR